MKTSAGLYYKYLITLCLFASLAACGKGEQKPQAGAGAMPPPAEVDVVTVKPGAATLTQDLPGRLQAYRSAQVRARVEGIVEQRKYEEGSDVEAGQTLYQIAPRNYQTAYEAAKANLDAAKQTLERFRKLLEAKVVSQQDYDLTEAKYRAADAQLSRAQEDLDNTRVPAPIAGRIGRSQVSEGALVGHGDATLLTTIEQINPIYANFTQSEAEIFRLQQAMNAGKLQKANSAKVELVLEDGRIYSHPGKLLFSDRAVDPNTATVSLRAEFPNPGHALLPGMFVQIRFAQAVSEKAITVPQRAVQINNQGQFVLVVDAENKVSPRPVKTGAMSGANFIVTDGLHAGDQVIVNGLQKARPGSAVKPVEWNPNAPILPAPPAAPPAVSAEKK